MNTKLLFGLGTLTGAIITGISAYGYKVCKNRWGKKAITVDDYLKVIIDTIADAGLAPKGVSKEDVLKAYGLLKKMAGDELSKPENLEAFKKAFSNPVMINTFKQMVDSGRIDMNMNIIPYDELVKIFEPALGNSGFASMANAMGQAFYMNFPKGPDADVVEINLDPVNLDPVETPEFFRARETSNKGGAN